MEPDFWTAASPEKPLFLTTGPRSGRTSRTTDEDKADAAGARFRTAGDTSNATAGENFGAGAVKAFEAAA